MRLTVNNISFQYPQGKGENLAPLILDGISCQFDSGKMYALMGKSGSGKSTFLSLLGKLEVPTEGNILYNGQDISQITSIEYLRSVVQLFIKIADSFHCLLWRKIFLFLWNYRK